MRIKPFLLTAFLFAPASANAMDMDAMMQDEQTVFHSFTVETDTGTGREGPVQSWDLDGWIGGDYNKLWIRSEGERADDRTEQAEFWGLYSRNISQFWDAQIGLRYDIEPQHTTYLTIGFEGLARYFFETQAHIFLSDEGNISLRIRQENDLLITQKLILQPYAELNLYAQDVPDQETGAGLAKGEIGLQTRYEYTRKFAPYLDLKYESKFGETANLAQSSNENSDDTIISAGVRIRF